MYSKFIWPDKSRINLKYVFDLFNTIFDEQIRDVSHGIFMEYATRYILNIFGEYEAEEI